jgi:hypothetical protein
MKLTPVRAFAPALVLLAVALAGCSGADGGGDSDASGAAAADADAPDARSQRGMVAKSAPRDGIADFDARAASTAQRPQEPAQTGPQQALIRQGSVELEADDVGKAQFETQKVVARYGGQVTEEKTTTGDDGQPAYTQMVLRIPSGDFDEAMEALKGLDVAELEAANTTEDDVTTKMIDVQTRLKVQKRSIARITVLFDRAESIRDIMAIEAQLSSRQANLDSLERQLSYLTNQTSLSTITVSIDQTPEQKEAPKKDGDDAGFVAGLSAGWHGLTTFAVGVATVLGALLPWLIVLLVLGPPALLVGRAIRRRTHRPEPATPAEA